MSLQITVVTLLYGLEKDRVQRLPCVYPLHPLMNMQARYHIVTAEITGCRPVQERR